MNFGAKKFFEKKIFLKNFFPGGLKLEVLQGLRRNYFVFCQILDKLTKSIKSYGPKKGIFKQNGHFGGIFSPKSPPGDANQIPKMGER